MLAFEVPSIVIGLILILVVGIGWFLFGYFVIRPAIKWLLYRILVKPKITEISTCEQCGTKTFKIK